MNCEAFIKTYLVQQNRRRAFRSVLPAFEYLSGMHRDGGNVPGALPALIQSLKDRDERDRMPVFHLSDKCDPALPVPPFSFVVLCVLCVGPTCENPARAQIRVDVRADESYRARWRKAKCE